jgi:SAM-dependent methyltransferase
MSTGADRELARISSAYKRYEASPDRQAAWDPANPGNQAMSDELDDALVAVLERAGATPRGPGHVLDVGCGRGRLLGALLARGATPDRLHGVDLLAGRVADARARLPAVDVRQGDGRVLPFPDGSMAAVVMCTVLSSVPHDAIRNGIVAQSLRVLAPGGVLAVYDLRVRSVRNPALRPVARADLTALAPGCTVCARSITLAPPIARRLGRATSRLYPALAGVPALRTHVLVEVRAPEARSTPRTGPPPR